MKTWVNESSCQKREKVLQEGRTKKENIMTQQYACYSCSVQNVYDCRTTCSHRNRKPYEKKNDGKKRLLQVPM